MKAISLLTSNTEYFIPLLRQFWAAPKKTAIANGVAPTIANVPAILPDSESRKKRKAKKPALVMSMIIGVMSAVRVQPKRFRMRDMKSDIKREMTPITEV